MTQDNLLRLHVTSLQRSCIALSNGAEVLVPGSVATAKTLYSLAGRLPGPLGPETESESPDSLLQSLALVDSARASLSYLTDAGQFSDLGLRIAQGILAALDTLESDLGRALRRDVRRRVRGLYVIIDPLVTADRPPEYIAEQALEGGATILQLRDKTRDKGVSIGLARRLNELCREKDALHIINDHADPGRRNRRPRCARGSGRPPRCRRPRRSGTTPDSWPLQPPRPGSCQLKGPGRRLHRRWGNVPPPAPRSSPSSKVRPLVSAVKSAVDVPVVAIGGITAERVPRGGEEGCRRHLRHQRRRTCPKPPGRRKPPRGSHPRRRRERLMPSLYADAFSPAFRRFPEVFLAASRRP